MADPKLECVVSISLKPGSDEDILTAEDLTNRILIFDIRHRLTAHGVSTVVKIQNAVTKYHGFFYFI